VHGHVVEHPETVATAIRIGNPASWLLAETARDESGGLIDAVSDQQILQAQRDLAVRDGVFVEPASAVGVAGLLARHTAGSVDRGQTVAVTVTGHGLKDIDTALDFAGTPTEIVIDSDPNQAARAAGLRDE
jgi:threonine synthase